MDEKFLRPYDPQATEERIYKLWEESGFFNPDVCIQKGVTEADAKPFSIVLPPPNVTGTLHMGHAAMLAVEDLLIRYNRMRGRRTLWVPGTDSAAIATQSKVESEIYKREKKTRHDLGREEFLKRIDAFAEESKDAIINQTKRMGASLDWSRYAFTLDEPRYRAVMTAFIRMHEAGLIYRGARIVNWDPKMQTTVSDDEIEYVEQTNPFYYLKYGPFTIGTARPETKFGDKYVVMHPEDERYKEYQHGQQLKLEWIGGPITATIIKDEAIDMEFGSGVMTITPWHDMTDFEIAERHSLEKEQIIDERGILLPIAGEFAGEHIKKARAKIVEKMRKKGLVESVDDHYRHNVATNSRGGEIIEPQIKEQWFVDVDAKFKNQYVSFGNIQPGQETTLKELMREAVRSGEIKIVPDRFLKTYYHWIDNLRDWCISRQIWYGHRIPVWYLSAQTSNDQKIKVQIESPGDGWEQDPDTLDTWFSSGLWTFSTLGWPEETADLKTYHPTSVLETGYDILFFWVARMILMTAFLRGEVPFKNVYLHGLVRDEKGRKMSKSLGNIIDPLDMIEKYGADATRLSLILGAAPGNDVPLSEERIRGYKHFANKLWNITRFVLENTEGIRSQTLNTADLKLVQERDKIFEGVTEDIENFRLHLAAEKLYHYTWDRFAAEIIEESKEILKAGGNAKDSRAQFLKESLEKLLKALHPFAPFVTEEIWQSLPADGQDSPNRSNSPLLVAPWPDTRNT
jgi:valyl-tRNA synthetase